MCGIVAVVRRRSDRTPPLLSDLLADLELAASHLDAALDATLPGEAGPRGLLVEAAVHVEAVDQALRGVPGVQALVADRAGADLLAVELAAQAERCRAIEARLDHDGAGDPDELELVNAALIRVKDALWAVARDRLRAGREVAALAAGRESLAAIESFASGAGRALVARPARSAGSGQCRAPALRDERGRRSRGPRDAAADRRARGRPAVPIGWRARRGAELARVRLQGRRRDRRAR